MADKNKIEYIKRQNQYILQESNAIKKPNSKTTPSTLCEYKEAPNGKVYGIVKEYSNFYVKVAPKKNESILCEDFDYIGGLQHKNREKYSSLQKAQNRLNLKLKNMNENFVYPQNLSNEGEIPKNSELDKNSKKEVEEPSSEEPSSEPKMDDEPSEAEPKVPLDTPEEQSEEPQPETSEETPEEIESSDAPSSDDTTEKEINSLLGKISGEVSRMGKIEPELTRKALNTIISSFSEGFEGMDEKTKEKLIRRIERDGEKIEESLHRVNETISDDEFKFKNQFVEVVENTITKLEEKGEKVTPESVLKASALVKPRGLTKEELGKIKNYLENRGDSYNKLDESIDGSTMKKIKKYIKSNKDNFMDSSGEIKLTEFAEDIIDKFNISGSDEDDIFDVVVDMTPEAINEVIALSDDEKLLIESIVKDEVDSYKKDLSFNENLKNIVLEEFDNHKKKLLKEEFEEDDEYYEVKLEDMVSKYQELLKFIDQDQNIPAWVQEKLVISKHNADSLYDYYRTKMKKKEEVTPLQTPDTAQTIDGTEGLTLQEEYDNEGSTDLEAAKDIVKDIISESLNENVFDKLKRFSKPVVLAAFLSLLSNNMDAAIREYTDSMGEPPSKEIVQQAKETVQDSSESKEVTKKNSMGLKIAFPDNKYKLTSAEASKLDTIINQYAEWKSKQNNKSVGDDLFIGVLGQASIDPSKPIAEKSDIETAKAANEYFAKLRAKTIFDYITIKTTSVMRKKYGVENFKFPDALNSVRLGNSDQAAIGFKVLGENDPSQGGLVYISYGNKDDFANQKNKMLRFIGTTKSKNVIDPEKGTMQGQIHQLDDFTNNSELVNMIKSIGD